MSNEDTLNMTQEEKNQIQEFDLDDPEFNMWDIYSDPNINLVTTKLNEFHCVGEMLPYSQGKYTGLLIDEISKKCIAKIKGKDEKEVYQKLGFYKTQLYMVASRLVDKGELNSKRSRLTGFIEEFPVTIEAKMSKDEFDNSYARNEIQRGRALEELIRIKDIRALMNTMPEFLDGSRFVAHAYLVDKGWSTGDKLGTFYVYRWGDCLLAPLEYLKELSKNEGN